MLHNHYAVPGRLGRVLVVDDEAQVRKPISLTLQKAGYEVLEAADGEEAIQLLNAGDNRLMVDVILCDLRMPKVDGIGAIEYFRTHYPTVPVIVLTGYPDVDRALSYLRCGLEYLIKPASQERLLASIHHAVAERTIHV
jgi:two-component system chemotaxis response regulator CheY